MLVLVKGGKLENPEKTLGAGTRTNSKQNPYMRQWVQELNPGHIDGKRAISPLCCPCTPPSQLPNGLKCNHFLQNSYLPLNVAEFQDGFALMSVECRPPDLLFCYSAALSLSLGHQQLLYNVLLLLQSLCGIESG